MFKLDQPATRFSQMFQFLYKEKEMIVDVIFVVKVSLRKHQPLQVFSPLTLHDLERITGSASL